MPALFDTRRPSLKKSYWPSYRINVELVDLLVESRLMLLGIHDTRSYFGVFSSRIIFCVSVCAIVGAVMGGIGGMLGGVLAGILMPLMLVYFSIIAPMILLQMAGLVLGIAWVLFCLWAIFKMIFG